MLEIACKSEWVEVGTIDESRCRHSQGGYWLAPGKSIWYGLAGEEGRCSVPETAVGYRIIDV